MAEDRYDALMFTIEDMLDELQKRVRRTRETKNDDLDKHRVVLRDVNTFRAIIDELESAAKLAVTAVTYRY